MLTGLQGVQILKKLEKKLEIPSRPEIDANILSFIAASIGSRDERRGY